MNKKISIGIGIVILIVIVGAIVISQRNSSYQNPQTLDELKDAKASGGSEYDKCLKEVEANEQEEIKCIQEKLIAGDYTDGVDCIQEYDNPICDEIDRYNAEVDASNECMEEYASELTILDCANLMGK